MKNMFNTAIHLKEAIYTVVIVSFSLLTGCTDYTPQKTDNGTNIPAGTFIDTVLEKSIPLIPNQYTDIRLSVPSINGKNVSGVYLAATVTVDAILSRANMKLDSMTFESKKNNQTFPISGFISDSEGSAGVNVRCNRDNTEKCGLYILDKNDTYWKALIQKAVDISGVTIMVEKP